MQQWTDPLLCQQEESQQHARMHVHTHTLVHAHTHTHRVLKFPYYHQRAGTHTAFQMFNIKSLLTFNKLAFLLSSAVNHQRSELAGLDKRSRSSAVKKDAKHLLLFEQKVKTTVTHIVHGAHSFPQTSVLSELKLCRRHVCVSTLNVAPSCSIDHSFAEFYNYYPGYNISLLIGLTKGLTENSLDDGLNILF